MIDLEESLTNYGSALERLIETNQRSAVAPIRRRSPRLVGAGAAVALVLVSGVIALGFAAARRSDPPYVLLSQTARTTLPVSPQLTAWERSAVDVCVAALKDRSADFPKSAIVGGEAQTSFVPLSAEPESARVILLGPSWQGECTVSATDSGPLATDTSFGMSAVRPAFDPSRAAIVVDNQSWYSDTAEGDVGPGWYEVTGRADPAVTRVQVELADHTTTTASLADGHFYVRVPVGDGVDLRNERIAWTMADGSTHTKRADLLDTETDAERCAAVAGCVSDRIATLDAQADGTQQLALQDGIVTDDEYHDALQTVVDCIRAGGGTASVAGQSLVLGDDSAPLNDQCQSDNLEFIDQVRALEDAARRLAEDALDSAPTSTQTATS